MPVQLSVWLAFDLYRYSSPELCNGANPAGYGSDRVRRRTKNDSNNSSSNGVLHTPSQLGTQQLTQVAEAAVGWLSNAAAAAQAALPAAANGLTGSCLREYPHCARPLSVKCLVLLALLCRQHAVVGVVQQPLCQCMLCLSDGVASCTNHRWCSWC